MEGKGCLIVARVDGEQDENNNQLREEAFYYFAYILLSPHFLFQLNGFGILIVVNRN